MLGVVWFHVWQAFHNISWRVAHIGAHSINLNEPISIGQTGVDLFFVISGFCMYLMYARKQDKFSGAAYRSFLKARWLRIAPAYYAAAFAIAVGLWVSGHGFPGYELITNLTFTQHLLPNTNDLVAPFWSLATEWCFYLILPVFIVATYRWGFRQAVVISVVCSLVFRLMFYLVFPGGGHSLLAYDVQTFILARLVEFVVGIIVARLYIQGAALPPVLRGWRGFLLACVLAGVGRVWMGHQSAGLTLPLGLTLEVIGLPLMTVGYALVLWNVVCSASIFQRLLSTSSMQAMGRWSYSMYLWHAWPVTWVATAVLTRFGASPLTQHLAYVVAVVIMIPISWLSYLLFERPYFLLRAREKKPISAPEAVAL